MIITAFFTNKKYCLNCKSTYFYILQFVFNLIWTTVFFKLKMPKTALLVLFSTLFFTIMYFLESNTISKLLLFPYMLWLSFAGYLNTYIVINN